METSEELPDADTVGGWCRALGERGLLSAVSGVVVARPPVTTLGEDLPDAAVQAQFRAAQRDAVIEQVGSYNPGAVVCVGPSFGHTRPQWILPYGGTVTLDGISRTLTASYL
ncbi:MAG: hypothetical protein ACTII7_08920 [Galactobacter sp.]